MGKLIFKKELTKQRLKNSLVSMQYDQNYFERAKSIGDKVKNENGAKKACDAIEAIMRLSRSIPFSFRSRP